VIYKLNLSLSITELISAIYPWKKLSRDRFPFPQNESRIVVGSTAGGRHGVDCDEPKMASPASTEVFLEETFEDQFMMLGQAVKG